VNQTLRHVAEALVQKAGLIPTIVGMGAIHLLVPLGMFFNRSLRQMDAAAQSTASRTRCV
jgi:hypothetical protein